MSFHLKSISNHTQCAPLKFDIYFFSPKMHVKSYFMVHLNELNFNLAAVVCPKLTVPDNGGVIPSSCSQTNVEYGTRCVFYCGDGYELVGPRYTTCQNDKSWSEIAALSCGRGKERVLTSILRKHLSNITIQT